MRGSFFLLFSGLSCLEFVSAAESSLVKQQHEEFSSRYLEEKNKTSSSFPTSAPSHKVTDPPTNKNKSTEPSVVATEKATLSPTTSPKTLSPTEEAKPCKDSQAKFKVGNQKLRCPAVYGNPDLCVKAKVSKLCPMACGICVSKPIEPHPDSKPEISCKDSQAKFKVGNQKLKCPAVYGKPDLCVNVKVSKLCPMACGICKDTKPKPSDGPLAGEDVMCLDLMKFDKSFGNDLNCNFFAQPFDHWKCMNNQNQSGCIIPGSTPTLHCDGLEHEPKEPGVEVSDGNVENEKTCKDVIGKFEFQGRTVTCKWAAKKQWRCKNPIVAESCPNTCGFCK